MLRLRTLGTIDLAGDDGRSLSLLLGQPRRLALLLYLATATPPGLCRRDLLVTLFWPELDHGHARAALRQSMHVLRAALGDDVVVGHGAAVGVNTDRLWCDVHGFETQLDAGGLADALALYGGPFLAGFHVSGAPQFERWLDDQRERLRARAATAARALARQHERDAPEIAAQWAGQAARLEPQCEVALRQLIGLLGRAGDRAGAAHAFTRFARRLAADLGVEPSGETQRLVREILASGAAPADAATIHRLARATTFPPPGDAHPHAVA